MTEKSTLNVNAGLKTSVLLACAGPMVLVGRYRNWLPTTPVWMEKPLARGFSSKPVEAFILYKNLG